MVIKKPPLTNKYIDISSVEQKYKQTWADFINRCVDAELISPCEAEQFLLDIIDLYKEAQRDADVEFYKGYRSPEEIERLNNIARAAGEADGYKKGLEATLDREKVAKLADAEITKLWVDAWLKQDIGIEPDEEEITALKSFLNKAFQLLQPKEPLRITAEILEKAYGESCWGSDIPDFNKMADYLHEQLPKEPAPKNDTKVICLCGSTRFTAEMLITQWNFTKQGHVVLSWCALPDSYFIGEDKSHFGDQEGVKEIVDEVHKRKIDLCDEVFVLNIGGYIGESTKNEIIYALEHGKEVKYLEPEWSHPEIAADQLLQLEKEG